MNRDVVATNPANPLMPDERPEDLATSVCKGLGDSKRLLAEIEKLHRKRAHYENTNVPPGLDAKDSEKPKTGPSKCN